MKLERPLIVFDTETTGTSPLQDRIVQIALIKIFPDGTEQQFDWLINPDCSIPKESESIHGISDEDVLFSPHFKDIAYEILSLFKESDLSGYNAIKFDVPLLCQEFKRCGMELSLEGINILDPYLLYRLMEPHTLDKAHQHYCGNKIENAHNAMADARATWNVLQQQIKSYEAVSPSVSHYVEFCQKGRHKNAFDHTNRLVKVNSDLAINFGKYKGKTLKELVQSDPAYLEWIVTQDFSDKVKNAVQEVLNTKFKKT